MHDFGKGKLKPFCVMAFYKKQFNREKGVYYPQAIVVGKPVETKEVAERLAQISTVSKSDVAAVLGDIAGVVADFMRQGKSVHIEGLGTFRYTLDTQGVKNEADFDFNKQLKAVRVQFTPEREGATTRGEAVTRSLVPTGIEWMPLDGTAASAEEPDGEDQGGGSMG